MTDLPPPPFSAEGGEEEEEEEEEDGRPFMMYGNMGARTSLGRCYLTSAPICFGGALSKDMSYGMVLLRRTIASLQSMIQNHSSSISYLPTFSGCRCYNVIMLLHTITTIS